MKRRIWEAVPFESYLRLYVFGHIGNATYKLQSRACVHMHTLTSTHKLNVLELAQREKEDHVVPVSYMEKQVFSPFAIYEKSDILPSTSSPDHKLPMYCIGGRVALLSSRQLKSGRLGIEKMAGIRV